MNPIRRTTQVVSLSTGLLLLVCALMTGCSTTYLPGAGVPKLKELNEVPKGIKVSLVNVQPPADKIEISQSGVGRTVYADLHAWTDQAVKAMSRTLQKKGGTVDAAAPKTLKVAMTKAILSTAGGGWAFRCTVVFTIDVGDGQPITLGADDTSWQWPSACDAAIEKLVVVALNDERVLKYLTSTSSEQTH